MVRHPASVYLAEMINFRYHVVSLVAIFLSLGVGALFGGSFIKEGTVDVLRATLDNLKETTEELRRDVRSLERSNTALGEFASAAREPMVRGTLGDRTVLLLISSNTPDEVVSGVAATLGEAGATVDGAFRFSENLDGASDARRRQIAVALETDETDQHSLVTLLIARMAEALSGRQPGILQRLVAADLAEAESIEGVQPKPVPGLPSPGTAIVLLGGDADGNDSVEKAVFAPLARALVANTTVLAVGEPNSEGMELAGLLREDPSLRLVTVDGVAGPIGQTAIALGLRAAFEGRFGHYGSGEGAASLLPARP